MSTALDRRRGMRSVQVLVASCSGCARLSAEVGLPLVHIDVTTDADAAIQRLNQTMHGAGYRMPAMFQPIGVEMVGWSDWAAFRISPGRWPKTQERPGGVRLEGGRLSVDLPADVTAMEFRARLNATLRHLRLQEVTTDMKYMEARNDAFLPYTSEPRYTLTAEGFRHRGAKRVDDIYVIDPIQHGRRLAWMVATTRMDVGGVSA